MQQIRVRRFLTPEFLFVNYFWMVTVTAVLHRTVGIGWLSTLVHPIVIYSFLFRKSIYVHLNVMDMMWILIFLWMTLTWTYNDYPHDGILIIRCLASQIAYMMAYWISRRTTQNMIGIIIKKAYIPLVITSVIGIYCFFFRPEWYVQMITDSLYNREGTITENMYLEAFRLRSIFPSPYTLAYFCSIVLIYEFFLVFGNKIKNAGKHYVLIGLLIITLILAMMRAPMVCTVVGLLMAIYSGYRYGKISGTIIFKVFLIMIILLCIPIVLNKMDSESNKFFLSKITSVTENTEDFIEYRLFLDQRDSGLLGDGVGRHDMHADKYNPGTSIRDGEYMKIIQEQGYIGLTLFVILCFIALCKCLVDFKHLSFELCLLIMLLVCMIGANPLSAGDKHTIIFWLALGQIARHKTVYTRLKI